MLGAAQSSKVDKPDRTPASIDLSADDDGRSMHRLVSELYPDLTHGSQPLADIAPDAGVDHGMDCFADHGRTAGEPRGAEFHQGDRQVPEKRGIDHLLEGTACHSYSSPWCQLLVGLLTHHATLFHGFTLPREPIRHIRVCRHIRVWLSILDNLRPLALLPFATSRLPPDAPQSEISKNSPSPCLDPNT